LVGVPNVNITPTNLTATISNDTLNLAWPADHTGWRLLVQTSNVTGGLDANTNDWFTVSGSASVNQTNLPIDPNQPSVFYRLVYP